MAIHLPESDELIQIGHSLGLKLTADEADEYRRFIHAAAPALRLVEQLPDDVVPPKYRRESIYRPKGLENAHNAWFYKTSIKGALGGKLIGKRVAVKDNICVAEVPLANGASFLEGYIPEADATVVSRILDEGGEIVGKSVCEYFCFSGTSATSSMGNVENPRVPGHTSGGSSNGSAALLAANEIDLALGTDQAGSIRIPASFCGVVGLKPTFGLVPYTGTIGIEFTFDHIGPMARSVSDCALLLEVIAGDDGIDSRQRGAKMQPYAGAIGRGVRGLKIALVREGFDREESDPKVDAAVRRVAVELMREGAHIDEISIPWHNYGSAIWLPIGIEGPYHNIVHSHGIGLGWLGQYSTSFMKGFNQWHDEANNLAPTVKAVLLSGEVLHRGGGTLYAKAQNLRRRLRSEYDAALGRYNALIVPTTPMTAPMLIPRDAPTSEILQHCWSVMNNTCPFDISGHPAISVPCGEVDGKPVGLMVVGKHFDELTVFQIADAVHSLAEF